ncbi:MAG: hypothetical protein KJ072_07035 [Verrucomicrobia bacterium]|nr:hypothetical protein [Verrucomicrobiota bacterium]
MDRLEPNYSRTHAWIGDGLANQHGVARTGHDMLATVQASAMPRHSKSAHALPLSRVPCPWPGHHDDPVPSRPDSPGARMPVWEGLGIEGPAMNRHDLNNKRSLGTVPVAADGSAYFAVPAERFVYFQLLDANRMLLQSMRSGTPAQPGEMTGCVGCHENRRTADLTSASIDRSTARGSRPSPAVARPCGRG